MENTCNFETCLMAKKLKCKKPEECPNFKENWFTPKNSKGVEGEPILVKDCVNIRILIMIQELTNRMDSLHKSQDKLKNQTQGVNNTTLGLIKAAHKSLEQKQLKETIDG